VKRTEPFGKYLKRRVGQFFGPQPMKSKKASIGDIAEIETPAGLAYVQYTHDNENMGQLVRVLPGLYATRPADIAELAKQKELYFIFYTLNHALDAGQTKIISHESVPKWARPYPLMRNASAIDHDGRTRTWKILDASSQLTIDVLKNTPTIFELTPEQEKLSISVLSPHPALVKHLARGWTPERAEEMQIKARSDAKSRELANSISSDRGTSPKFMRHYLYFKEESQAHEAAKRLRSQGLSVEVRLGADRKNWLALASQEPLHSADDMEEVRDKMEAIASEFYGEYDGWEVGIDAATDV